MLPEVRDAAFVSRHPGTQLLHVSEADFKAALLSGATTSGSSSGGSGGAAGMKSGLSVPFTVDRKWYLDRYHKNERYEHVIYAQSRTLYEGVYLNLMTVLHWPMPGVVPGFRSGNKTRLFAKETGVEGWLHDRISPYLATSRDGRSFNFQWVYAKRPLLRGGTAKPDPMRIVMPAAQIVTRDGWHWLYFAGTPKPHTERWQGLCKIYLARWRQDRITGLRPQRDAAKPLIETKPFRWPVGALTLRVVVELSKSGASAAVALISTNGTTLRKLLKAEYASAAADGEQQNTGSSGASEVRVADLRLHALGDVQLRFALRGAATLYAFHITCGPCGCDGPPTDITCDKGNAFSKGLSGFDFAGQLERAKIVTQRMMGAIRTLGDAHHLGRAARIESLLEYGCATGITTRQARRALPDVRSAIGFDVDEAAIAKARRDPESRELGVEFLLAKELGGRTADLVRVCAPFVITSLSPRLFCPLISLTQSAFCRIAVCGSTSSRSRVRPSWRRRCARCCSLSTGRTGCYGSSSRRRRTSTPSTIT